MNWETRHDRTDERTLAAGEEPPLAAHLTSPRGFYSHHGVYVGAGRVIHYAGLHHGLRRGPVEEVSLDEFARGHDVRLRTAPPGFDRNEVVRRARLRLGEKRYRVLSNNCEHFCEWCLSGRARSRQVEALWGVLGRLTRQVSVTMNGDRYCAV